MWLFRLLNHESSTIQILLLVSCRFVTIVISVQYQASTSTSWACCLRLTALVTIFAPDEAPLPQQSCCTSPRGVAALPSHCMGPFALKQNCLAC